MHVLNCVAFVAGRWQVFVDFSDVASHAHNICMPAKKRELGLRVIEGCNPAPFADFMAILAVFAQVSLVRLVFFMAAKAGSRSFRPFLAFQVASVAFDLLVRA